LEWHFYFALHIQHKPQEGKHSMKPKKKLRRAELHATTAATELVSAGTTLAMMQESYESLVSEPDTRQQLEQSVINKLLAARANVDKSLALLGMAPDGMVQP
jgi:hypothetical protein